MVFGGRISLLGRTTKEEEGDLILSDRWIGEQVGKGAICNGKMCYRRRRGFTMAEYEKVNFHKVHLKQYIFLPPLLQRQQRREVRYFCGGSEVTAHKKSSVRAHSLICSVCSDSI